MKRENKKKIIIIKLKPAIRQVQDDGKDAGGKKVCEINIKKSKWKFNPSIALVHNNLNDFFWYFSLKMPHRLNTLHSVM